MRVILVYGSQLTFTPFLECHGSLGKVVDSPSVTSDVTTYFHPCLLALHFCLWVPSPSLPRRYSHSSQMVCALYLIVILVRNYVLYTAKSYYSEKILYIFEV